MSLISVDVLLSHPPLFKYEIKDVIQSYTNYKWGMTYAYIIFCEEAMWKVKEEIK
jgi:hypothetical protein